MLKTVQEKGVSPMRHHKVITQPHFGVRRTDEYDTVCAQLVQRFVALGVNVNIRTAVPIQNQVSQRIHAIDVGLVGLPRWQKPPKVTCDKLVGLWA